MKIREIIYFLGQAKFCFTAIKFLVKECVNHIKNMRFNASTYNNDKRIPLQKKAVEERCKICIGCKYFDWWNGECIYAGK